MKKNQITKLICLSIKSEKNLDLQYHSKWLAAGKSSVYARQLSELTILFPKLTSRFIRLHVKVSASRVKVCFSFKLSQYNKSNKFESSFISIVPQAKLIHFWEHPPSAYAPLAVFVGYTTRM